MTNGWKLGRGAQRGVLQISKTFGSFQVSLHFQKALPGLTLSQVNDPDFLISNSFVNMEAQQREPLDHEFPLHLGMYVSKPGSETLFFDFELKQGEFCIFSNCFLKSPSQVSDHQETLFDLQGRRLFNSVGSNLVNPKVLEQLHELLAGFGVDSSLYFYLKKLNFYFERQRLEVWLYHSKGLLEVD